MLPECKYTKYPFLGREKSKVLKSEIKVVKLKKNNQRKPLLRKSKLGEIVSKHRENITSECSVSENQNKKVFGRKFSLSLDNFNSLTLGERKEQSPENYSTESFKKINVRTQKNREHKLLKLFLFVGISWKAEERAVSQLR